VTTEKLL